MKRSLTIAFWNVHNLFREGQHPKRGPKSKEEREAKLDALAAVIGRLGNGMPPDLLALAEVSEESLIRDLLRRLPLTLKDPPTVVFESPQSQETGVAIAALTPVVAQLSRMGADDENGNRPHALSVRVTLAAPGTIPLYVVACHWKSDLHGTGALTSSKNRRESGKWLKKHLETHGGPNGLADPIVVVGDFNAEPFAPEISGDRALHATRHLSKSKRANKVRLFNTMWDWLVDPGVPAKPNVPVRHAPRSVTSWGRSEPKVLDQLMVSRSILLKEAFTLDRVDYHRDDDTAELLPQLLTWVPRPWTWDPKGRYGKGTSDHFPLVASLLY